jgi:hypothetical protein
MRVQTAVADDPVVRGPTTYAYVDRVHGELGTLEVLLGPRRLIGWIYVGMVEIGIMIRCRQSKAERSHSKLYYQ